MWRLTKSKDSRQFAYTLILGEPHRIVENALGHSFLHFLKKCAHFYCMLILNDLQVGKIETMF